MVATAGWSVRGGGVVRRLLTAASLAAALATGTLVAPPGAAAAAPPGLYLVTLAGPGTSGDRGVLPDALRRLALRREQDRALAAVGSPTPVYR